MKKSVLWLTETAVMLAVLITMQMVTKPLGQIVTGTCVNAVLGITALVCGVSSGAVVALISPIMAFLLGIAPQIITVPAIMVGNFVLVLVLGWRRKNQKNTGIALLRCVCAAVAKFAVLYILVVQLICNVAASLLSIDFSSNVFIVSGLKIGTSPFKTRTFPFLPSKYFAACITA